MAGSMVYRLRVSDPNDPHMATFIAASRRSQAISDNRGFNHIAGFHGAPGFWCWHHQKSSRTPLQARLFLPWHRAYLWTYEQSLQDIDAATALPWWDWTFMPTVPPAYTVAKVGGQTNPLRGSKITVPQNGLNRRTRARHPGATPGSTLPSSAEIVDLLADTDWASFSDRLEDFHDEVHVWVGGDMRDISVAAFDPVFWAHHCMIDRLWYLWQVKHGNGGFPHELLDLPLQPFNKTPRDVLDVQALGYEYALTAHAVTGAPHG